MIFHKNFLNKLAYLIKLLRKPRNTAIALKYIFWTHLMLIAVIGLIVYFKWFPTIVNLVSDRKVSNILPMPPTQTEKTNGASKLVAADKPFFDEQRNLEGVKIDWHDHHQIFEEKKRIGIGEGGKPGVLSAREKVREQEISLQNGFNGLLSDKISVNRSLPDIRHAECRTKKYLKELPTVSVIFPFFDEHWTTLLRSVYSILNRSPPQLIREIILVNDHSDRDILYEPLEQFIQKNLPKVVLVHLPERSGLIKARIAGAEVAKADVLVFLDSHIEVNVNWLPPLLEPIAENYKVCVCPLIDVIRHKDFEYVMQDNGARGSFNWGFFYKRLPLLPRDLLEPTAPFESPIMAGGLFAISAKFFWELGGYDEGLDIWGGEQYELSFKIWQCGGKMYDAPCSRVGHIYRGPRKPVKAARNHDYVGKNFKRVAEVWMDEYKEIIYKRNPNRYANIDAGDLTKQKAIRDKLQCKSFKWFLENVAMDLLDKYPPYPPPSFASGAIQSLVKPSHCVDALGSGPYGLYPCSSNLKEPNDSQYFLLSWQRDIRHHNDEICWEASNTANAEVNRSGCHGNQGSQLWKYNYKTKTIHYRDMTRCLDADIKTNKVFLNKCDMLNPNQQWTWGEFNETMIDSWDETVNDKFQKNK